ncbi:MAG TPA: tRNA lysidine(34) synthetase TilS, partial [Marinobacter sp.]|nr:tRNA lysidine(34) synthetase TilS [Marinobacter sp.]
REVSWPGCVLRVYQGRLYALAKTASWEPETNQPAMPWPDPHTPLLLPGGDRLRWQQAGIGEGLAAKWLNKPWQVCWRQGGERSHPMGRGHSQTVKKLLQEYQLPLWLRARVPLLMVDGQLAAVADLWVDEAFRTPPEQPGYCCLWQLTAAPTADATAISD